MSNAFLRHETGRTAAAAAIISLVLVLFAGTYAAHAAGEVTTDPATNVTASDATLNATNGLMDATDSSFWVSTSTIDTSSSDIPHGVYSTQVLGPVASSTMFSAQLSSVTTSGITTGGASENMAAITPDTTYYYVAWVMIDGTWYHGDVETVTTAPATTGGGDGSGGNDGTPPPHPTNMITVTPSELQSWTLHKFDHLDGSDNPVEDSGTGSITFTRDDAATGSGSVRLSTPANDDEVMLDRVESPTPVTDINISYASKSVSGTDSAPAYILGIDTNADGTADLYAFYEPGYNGGSNYDQWNTWTVDRSSQFWSFSNVGTKGGANGANLFTLADVEAAYPGASVVEYTINLGSGNPGWSVLVDDVTTPSGIFNFEPTQLTSRMFKVTRSQPRGWAEYGSAAGGAVNFVRDTSAPMGHGALSLTTSGDVNSVTHYALPISAALADFSASYVTKQISAADATNGNATLRLSLDLNGDGEEDDQLMYEPYYNGFSGGTDWNTWTIDTNTGKFWSNYDMTYNGMGGVGAGSYDSNFTLADVLHDYPNAKVTGLILSMGTYNVSQTVEVDSVSYADANSQFTYDFETTARSSRGGGGGSSRGGQRSPTTDTTSSPAANGPTQGSTGGQVLGASTFQFTVNLHVGSLGNDVTELQKLLIAAGYLHISAPTGYFGLLTKAAVAAFQHDHGIAPAVGFFGPITRAYVNANGLMSAAMPVTTTTTITSSTSTSH